MLFLPDNLLRMQPGKRSKAVCGAREDKQGCVWSVLCCHVDYHACYNKRIVGHMTHAILFDPLINKRYY